MGKSYTQNEMKASLVKSNEICESVLVLVDLAVFASIKGFFCQVFS